MKKARWNIVLEDDHLIVVDKPARYLSIPDRYDSSIPNMHQSLLKFRPSIFINHRLDKDTSGLMLFSKTEECHKKMSMLFENGLIDKYYKALVHGTPIERIGQIDLNLMPSQSTKKGIIVNSAGKRAITKYRILESWNSFSLLEIKLITGRMHQIRVHMQSINCPLVCDELYGDGREFFLSDIKKKYRKSNKRDEQPLLSRQALHSSALSFKHPLTNKEIKIESPLPKDIKACVQQLKKTQISH